GWLDALLAGIALGMSMLPEEFPLVLTVFMAMGAWRISQARVLTRRAAAIETLGSATVLCTDKTGTLTENRMSIAELHLGNNEVFLPREGTNGKMGEAFCELAKTGLLASALAPSDPMEKAFHELDRQIGLESGKSGQSGQSGQRQGTERKLVHAYGLRPDLLAMSHVWQSDRDSQLYEVAAKGAPEAIFDLCHLGAADRAAMMSTMDAMAAQGLRILGVARASYDGQVQPPVWPESQREFNYRFLGLVGLADPLRPSVPAAIRECQSAGIRVVMITGDYPATACAIARQAGLNAEDAVTGDMLEKMNEAELALRVRTATVFARIMPEQKLRVVQALKANGEVVAMTGDGVNDAPSLKAAHIGIAMGGRGTDVAREAAAIVLLDDDFGSIVKAVRLGRRIYDNLRKAMGFIIAVHVPIAGLALLPLLFGLPILFGPMHIAFLEMVIDPVCSLVFEAETEEADVMRRPPRSPGEPLFSRSLIGWSLLQGILALALLAIVFVVALRQGMHEDEVRALVFFSLVMSIVGLIFVNRTYSASLVTTFRRPNAALIWVLLVVATSLALTLLWPFARGLFRFGPLHLDDLSLTLGVGILLIVVLEWTKARWRRRQVK
ncbi:MAG: cation-translocating P-type ATPase, partial [Betaproteobacteria bacterium]